MPFPTLETGRFHRVCQLVGAETKRMKSIAKVEKSGEKTKALTA